MISLYTQEEVNELRFNEAYKTGFKIGFVLGVMKSLPWGVELTSERVAEVFGISKEEFEDWCDKLPDSICEKEKRKRKTAIKPTV